jgi:DNA-binding Xre family transcriptional regulator
MQPLSETRRIQKEVKTLLKKQGFSYRCLAGELGVSVPTVKRTLTAPDITLGRLTHICNFLGVEVHEVLEIARSSDRDLYLLNSEQEAYFAKYPHFLHYLFALYNAKKTPAEIEKICSLSKRSTHRYLKKLAELNLIRVLPRGTVRFLFTGLIGWKEEGLLGPVISDKTIQDLSKSALERTSQYLYLEMSGRRLTAAQYEEMKKDFREVVAKYRRISKVNSASRNRAEVNRYQMMIVADRTNERYAEIRELP